MGATTTGADGGAATARVSVSTCRMLDIARRSNLAKHRSAERACLEAASLPGPAG